MLLRRRCRSIGPSLEQRRHDLDVAFDSGYGSGEREEELDDYYYTWVGHFTLLVTTNKALPN